MKPWIGAAVAAAALGLAVVVARAEPWRGPVVVAGDSYAVGIAAAVQRAGRLSESWAVGGTSTPQLPAGRAVGEGRALILSIGTNDAAGTATPASIAARARAWVEAVQPAAAAVVLPHDRLPGPLAARCRAVAAAMRAERWPRGVVLVEHREVPAAPDRVHFTAEQYARIAALALAALRDRR